MGGHCRTALGSPAAAITYVTSTNNNNTDGRFIASGARGVVVSSADGREWTVLANDLRAFDQTIQSLAYHNDVFVGVSATSTGSAVSNGLAATTQAL